MIKYDPKELEQFIANEETVVPETVTPEIATNPPTESDVSILESMMRGGAQGATMGYADELTGALGSLGALGTEESLAEAYRRERDASRAAYEAAEQANPVAYGASEVGGGILSSIIPVGAAAKGGAGALKAAGMLGAASGLGTSEADLTQGDVINAAKDAAFGGVLGVGLGYAGKLGAEKLAKSELGQKAMKSITDKLEGQAVGKEKEASAQIARSLGATKSEVKNINADEELARRFGRTITEEDALPTFGSAKAVDESVEKAISKQEDIINSKLSGINPEDVGENELEDLMNQLLEVQKKFEQEQIDALGRDSGKAAANTQALRDKSYEMFAQAVDDPIKIQEFFDLYNKRLPKAPKSGVPSKEAQQDMLMRDVTRKKLLSLADDTDGQLSAAQQKLSDLERAKTFTEGKLAEPNPLMKLGMEDTMAGGIAASVAGAPSVVLPVIAAKKGIESLLGDRISSLAQRAAGKSKLRSADALRASAVVDESGITQGLRQKLAGGTVGADVAIGNEIQSDKNVTIDKSIYAQKAAKLDDSNPRDVELKKLLLDAAQDPSKARILQFKVKSDPALMDKYNSL